MGVLGEGAIHFVWKTFWRTGFLTCERISNNLWQGEIIEAYQTTVLDTNNLSQWQQSWVWSYENHAQLLSSVEVGPREIVWAISREARHSQGLGGYWIGTIRLSRDGVMKGWIIFYVSLSTLGLALPSRDSWTRSTPCHITWSYGPSCAGPLRCDSPSLHWKMSCSGLLRKQVFTIGARLTSQRHLHDEGVNASTPREDPSVASPPSAVVIESSIEVKELKYGELRPSLAAILDRSRGRWLTLKWNR